MKHLPLAIGSALCLTFFAAVGCRPKPKSDIVGEPSPDQPPSSPIIASRKGYRIESVPITTVYSDEVSKIHPARDTIRFFKLMRRYRRV